ncbi:MAG TPA: amino acid adenylation domain-containing protein, partial [Thermoanaerobaculia bacterium]|nr:amino acid adenylation domain-containing protein [Thermoanaerobaculia bacterium]
PAYPRERLAWLLADSGAPVLVAGPGAPDGLPAGRVLPLADDPQGRDDHPGVPLPPEAPAYLIYTSGSTGRPKGVVVTHANVARLFEATDHGFGFGPADVWTLFHSYAFDFSVWELWGALLHGGRLVVVPYLVSRSPEAFRALLAEEGVTVLNQTPSAFRQLMHVPGGPLALRLVIFGGEALDPRSLAPWAARHGVERPALVNLYGITETTVHVTWRVLGGEDVEAGAGSVIGVPIPDLRVFLLDRAGNPVPVGVSGELHVGGAGVAAGYLGRPALTAERFVPDPFGGPGARLYRSGDLARWRASGELEYLGRIDHQVKIRGFRIELGEIEAALARHPGVREAVVLAREERLVAWIVGRDGAVPTVEELRRHLAASLPEPMIPAAFVALDALPLTPNGKLDRQALPEPGAGRPELGEEYAPPRGAVEEALCEVWARVLKVERVGIHDNFFALGGDSILSLQVVAQAGERGLAIELADLFRGQTVAELASLVSPSGRVRRPERTEPFDLVSAEDRARLPEDAEDAYPLTFLQAGMLYHMELSPEDAPYHNVDSWRLRGRFEEEPFREAVARVVARHPVLRTSFATTGFSEPLQIVRRRAELPVGVEDLRNLPAPDQEAAVDGLVAREKRRLFDFTAAPQLRFHVHRLTDGEFQLTLTENHAILDGWSLHSTLSEIFDVYFDLLDGKPVSEPEEPGVTFRDYVHAERRALELPEAREYWDRVLGDGDALELPRWPDAPAPEGPRARVRTVPVAPEVFEGLKALARGAGVPLRTVLLAAHVKALSVLSGQPEVMTAQVTNGRLEEPGGDRVRGLFLNSLPFRFRLPAGSWAGLARAVLAAEEEMLPFRRYPFGALQRDRGQRPLVEVAFNYIHFHVVQDLLSSGRLEVLGMRRAEGTNFKLTANVSQNLAGTGIEVGLEHDARALPPAQAAAIGETYARVLAAMAREPAARHDAVPLLSAAERHQIVLEWNDAGAAFPAGACLHELFEAQAARTPGAVALVSGDRRLTYAELNAEVNRLARRLRRSGVALGSRVGICLPRSIEMMVALWGVLKAGGAYVPLDPSYPAERLALMTGALGGNAGVPVLLTRADLADRFSGTGAELIFLDAHREEIAREDAGNLPPGPRSARPDGLLYVIHTSGSTGVPKGAGVFQRGFVNLLAWYVEEFAMTAADRVLLVSSFSFDLTQKNYYAPLVLGGELHLAAPDYDPEAIAETIARQGITIVNCTPSAFYPLLEEEGFERLASLRCLFLGGEPISLPRMEPWRTSPWGRATIANTYGPTECTDVVSYHRLPPPEAGAASVPLGRPVRNCVLLILGPGLSLVPLGAAGELWVGGVCVGAGYLRDPALTAEKFLPDPFSGVPGARLYRTGDLARTLPSGEIEYLGRIDHQVKVRGVRVELGEVEAALSRHPCVREAVALVRRDRSGEGRLVAFVVPRGEGLDRDGLRAFLRDRLPEAVTPSALRVLDAFPLLPSGKVDRRALAALEPAPERAAASGGAAPRTPAEELLAGLFAEVLGVERVGVGDDFFDLGGHSLLATRLVARVRAAFGVQLPLRAVFDAPTVTSLAARLTTAEAATPPIERVSRERPLPLSFSQQRLWFLDRLEEGVAVYNIPAAFRLNGPLDARALAATLTEIVRRHEVLRTTFATGQDGEPVQVIAPPAPFPLPVVDLGGLPGPAGEQESLRLAREEERTPFDLEAGPLLRAVLVTLGPERQAVLLTMHHIVGDAWSTGLLVRELRVLYGSFSRGLPSPLPELPVQYADFAVWQRRWLSGETLAARLAWWRERLGGPEGGPPPLELPTDRPRPALQSFEGATRPVAVPRELADELRRLSRREGVTLFMTLLASFQTLLSRYTGQEDVAVGTPISGREQLQTEDLIGFFVNTLVLRTDLGDGPEGALSARGLLARVREVALGSYAHQEVPFEKLVEELQPARSLARSPLFQVMFALQNQSVELLEIPGLTLEPLPVSGSVAKFDLSLSLADAGGGLHGELEHNRDLFESATIERMAGHWLRLLEGIAADPDRRVAELPLLSPAERERVLAAGRAPQEEPAEPRTLHGLFEDQAARSPEAVAVVLDGFGLTYAELNAWANRLARRLRRLGVGPEVPVALCAEGSPARVAAVFGILKAGGVYVPLDPAYPAERLAWIVEDAGAPVLVTEEKLRPLFAGSASRILSLDGDAGAIATESGEGLPDPVAPENLAYVIYTSGSTGRPKGVCVSHGEIAHHLRTAAREYALVPEDRMLQFASPGFDVSLEEMFGALLAGASLFLRGEALWSSADLWRAIAARRLTVVNLPTAYWQQVSLDPAPDGVDLGSMRLLITGGEAMPPHAVAPWWEKAPPGSRLLNGYGPTETLVTATIFEVPDRPGGGASSTWVPIGHPFAGREAHILDRTGEPVPAGIPGELFLGGRLARGYLHRPDATAERFVPDRFGALPGGRLYRTGDLVRRLPDGALDFLGRVDQQVKIRGFRIEPGEIEAALAEHPGVREAAVLAVADTAGGRRLAAWIVPGPEGAPAPAELRAFLAPRLPEYMLPSVFAEIAELPLTAHGKVDRRALERLEVPVEEAGPPAGAPGDPVVELLSGIFAGVLGVERVGAGDDFFERGGHSLLATRLVSRLREALGVEVPVRAVFEAPTPAALAARISRADRTAATAPPLEPVPRDGLLPASFSQRRLWFLDRLQPGSPAYNLPVAVRLSGDLDAPALAAAFTALAGRQESLRTAFAEADGEPVQAIAPAGPFLLPRIDLWALPEAERARETLRLAGEEAGRPFELARGPLTRAALLVLGEREHALLLTMHHIVSDGWSMGILVSELGALYTAFSAGRPSPLPTLGVQYADFAAWQRKWLRGEELESQLAWWREELAGLPAVLDLRPDRPRPAILGTRGARVPVHLSPHLARDLRALARREGATPFMVLWTAFQVLLMHRSGQADFAVGSPVANRTRSETEPLIGFFVNTLVLRAKLAGDPPFRELLGRARATALGAYTHQDLPFEKLVEELAPVRSLGHAPLFQVMLALDGAPAPAVDLGGLRLEAIGAGGAEAKFDLLLSLSEEREGISGSLEYNLELFDACTIERLRGHLEVLLSGALLEPERRISDLPRLTVEERRQLLVEWNRTETDWPEDVLLHEPFQEQARRHPGAVALIAGSERLSYGELAARAGRLARRHHALGVGPEDRVGIFLERTPRLLVALLAVLEAGGAYVPLDPAHPRERLETILGDAGASVLVTEEALLASVPHGTGVRILRADQEEPVPGGDLPDAPVRSDRLAYLIYTSGSTGRPKGVAIEHRSAAALVSWARETFRPGELARVLASTSISFDLSVFEIFAPLSCGGAVVLAENALALPGLPAASEVTLLNTVPSAMAELLRQGAVPASARTVNLAGEPLRGALARDILDLGTVTRLLNLYGPSEDTTYSTLAQVDGEGEPTIGRPLPNTRAYLLDPHLQPVEMGVPGELCLAGRGLARGYLGRPDLTAERFLPDPFGERPGARLYRTGDLARYLRDGQLEFLGRLDHQVKVRGFRIELGEVEAALMGHPSLRDAAVLALGEGTDRRLVAYAVAREGTDAPDLARLRTFLQGRLPDFMLPSALVLLGTLPLTPNGKVDRRALAAIGIEAGPGEARAALRTPVEELLAGIWAEVLRREGIGARDDFFALGGHSLLATRLVSRVREAFGVELPLRTVFEAPTVEALALRIEEAATGLSRPPVGRADRSRPLPLSFAQQRLWFLDRLDPGSPVYNLPERVRLRGALDASALAAALREVVRRHEALRTTFALVDGEPVQVIHPEVPVPLPRVDLSDLSDPGREILRLAGVEARRGFDLALGPLLRATLLAVGEEEHVLFLTLHHVVADGWSMPVLVREMGTLYGAFSRGLPSPLPELPVQYADFAAWQRRWLAGEVLERELAYWRGQLGDAPPVLDLPTDRPRPPIQTFPGSHRPLRLPPERLADLQALSRRSGTTLFMTLLAAFQALLAHHSGQDDLTVGTPIAGRNQLETEGLIGFFVNTLVLRGDLSDAPTVRELLARTRETALAAYGHQDVPFEKLVEDLHPARSLAHAPLFQVMFVLQNVPPPLSGEGTGLALEPLALESDVARFDLTLSLAEIGGGLSGALEYNTDLFDDTAMERMAGHLRLLLEALPGDPGRRTSDLPWLEEPELAQVIREWNDTASEPLWDGPVHAAFERRAEESPGAPALVFEGETTSYGELDRRADRLAAYLASLGVGPESRVGVWLEPSPRMIVALLGIHKAGGAYVPLDPAYPEDRLALMLADSEASVLLTEERFLPALSRHAVRRVCLDSEWDEVERAALPARPRVHAGSAAYVIYTSGSTGTPKGVVATHGGLANFTRAMVRSLGLGPGDRMLLFASLSFDASAVQIFPTLASGAALVLHRSARSLTPSEMIALAAGTGMTVLDLPVVLWKPLVAHVRSTGERLPATIRRAMTGGEAMADALLRDLAAGLSPEAEVVSSYGPTEATITATVFRIPARDAAGFDLREVPLGRPLPNVRVHLVDRDFRPVPAGVVGEVVIAGAGVTRGYLHQPGLTAERFLPDPWAPEPGARLYRTGDLARALPDGRLQFLGRRDHQVKLRGYRIEPGEIEAAIAALPGVRDQVVTLRE